MAMECSRITVQKKQKLNQKEKECLVKDQAITDQNETLSTKGEVLQKERAKYQHRIEALEAEVSSLNDV